MNGIVYSVVITLNKTFDKSNRDDTTCSKIANLVSYSTSIIIYIGRHLTHESDMYSGNFSCPSLL